MQTSFRLVISGAVFALGAVAGLRAQPPSATFRPALIESFASSYSYSGEADVERGIPLAEVSVHHLAASASSRAPLNQQAQLAFGAAFSHTAVNTSAPLALPDTLSEWSLNLGWLQRFSERWSSSVFLRPGFYTAGEDFSSDALNVPVLAMANYASSPDLVWLFGVSANPFSDREVMPVAGVRWKFAPDWLFSIGFPRAGFTWELDPKLALKAGLGIQGGSFRVTEKLGSPAPGVARLEDSYLQYREIRVGVGADWKPRPGLTFAVETGIMTDRRFEYYERNYTLNGRAAPYLTLSASGRF